MANNTVIHHWDTDGICLAAIVAMVLEKKKESWVNYTLQIGKFEFDKRVIKEAFQPYLLDSQLSFFSQFREI